MVSDLTPSNVISMAVFTILLVSLALWAQTFRRKPQDIIGRRNLFLGLSGILIVLCAGAMLIKGFNWGMDFTGGTVIEVGFYDNLDSLTTQKISSAIMEVNPDLKEPQVQVEEQVVTGAIDNKHVPAPAPAPAPTATAPAVPKASPSTHGFVPTGSVPVQLGGESGTPASSPAAASSTAPSPAASTAPSPAASVAPSPAASLAPSPAASVAPSPAASSVAPSPAASSTAAPAAPNPLAGRPYKRAIIRLGKKNNDFLKTDEIATLLTGMEQKLGPVTNPPLSTESISPTIGAELFASGLTALAIALLLQLIYITFRFGNQIRFGIAADVALIHDVIIMTGFYALSGRQVDSPFLAALLTVIGYSVMDSIVIFDRIRENLKIFKKSNFEEVVNKSVNETMTRSINTLMTVLLCLFALYHFGGGTLRNFAFALLVGITSGAYSSIFIASPILVLWEKWARKGESERVAARRASLAAASSKPAPPRPAPPVETKAPDVRAAVADVAGERDEEGDVAATSAAGRSPEDRPKPRAPRRKGGTTRRKPKA